MALYRASQEEAHHAVFSAVLQGHRHRDALRLLQCNGNRHGNEVGARRGAICTGDVVEEKPKGLLPGFPVSSGKSDFSGHARLISANFNPLVDVPDHRIGRLLIKPNAKDTNDRLDCQQEIVPDEAQHTDFYSRKGKGSATRTRSRLAAEPCTSLEDSLPSRKLKSCGSSKNPLELRGKVTLGPVISRLIGRAKGLFSTGIISNGVYEMNDLQ